MRINPGKKFMRSFGLLFFAFVLSISLLAQGGGSWEKTAFLPSPSSRNNDGFFLNENVGWAVNGVGQIHRTTNGGAAWVKLLDKGSSTHFRSVAFFDSLHGNAGALGWGDPNNTSSVDTNILYKTSTGGTSWVVEPQLSSSNIKRGFCGMQAINDSVIVGVGRVRGPAWFYKTTDRGATWTAKDMNSYAGGLIDVYFRNAMQGWVVGLTNTNHTNSSGIVLYTSDGGETWTPQIVTARTGEWCWKIQFPTTDTGYVSLQRNSLSPIYFLKTTDAGFSWEEKLFSNSYYFVQGMGFINGSLGWAGGNSSNPMWETTNGGDNWHPLTLGRRVNRFRIVNQYLAYAFGDSIYKYSAPFTSIREHKEFNADVYQLDNNYPNPFNPNTVIEFSLKKGTQIRLRIYNTLGEIIRTIAEGYYEPGNYKRSWDGENEAAEPMPSGQYFYRLEGDGIQETKKMILLR